ncbi:hypothetical protein COW38_03140 [Candidatus Collierbacteria bacterium CG17_big_fil_post_rev_8_21_14_2_50_45_7]|uniref:Uncharacterized protein n=2 Tax=Candidatus Collieribacteriota TaxID=1752725 RepID=A0A2H0WZF4_9BACT|nr:MAG: hypothetical protein COT54_01480 [Candidatus Collierbacteria bacterium CG09_land_8_20_14_0_10_46_12]PIW07235.1 MAG: hypothetical protein COW38_03140 [Candidatus Collierbacteria bacterium CG17_big_fil_post_rev_8_21_14_2_50_45_7]
MLNYQDEQTIKRIVQDVVHDEVKKQLEPHDIKIDKILKIVSDDRKEQVVIKARVTTHHKRLVKIERKLKITSPAEVAIA